jgi:hypothetical protein
MVKNFIEKALKISIIFLIGFLCANVLSFYLVYGLENPFSYGFNLSNIKKAPTDYIKENQIEVTDNEVIIHVSGASISRYAATGSMKPTFDENANGIRIVPKSSEDIKVGDIITYKSGDSLIVHRVIEIGTDSSGLYFIPKGDNNDVSDGKVRFSDIKYITIGLLY